jgi:hypothetical protein
MAVISEESRQATYPTGIYTAEQFNMNGTWDIVGYPQKTYRQAFDIVIVRRQEQPFAYLRIEALEKSDEGINIWYDHYT